MSDKSNPLHALTDDQLYDKVGAGADSEERGRVSFNKSRFPFVNLFFRFIRWLRSPINGVDGYWPTKLGPKNPPN